MSNAHLFFRCYIPSKVCIPPLESVLVEHASYNGLRRQPVSASYLVFEKSIGRTGTATWAWDNAYSHVVLHRRSMGTFRHNRMSQRTHGANEPSYGRPSSAFLG